MSFPRYPKYKPSGVEWLGEVPEHWIALQLRRCLLEHRQGYYSPESYVDSGIKLLRITDLREFGLVDFSDCPRVEDQASLAPFLLQTDDFVFARTGGAGTFGLITVLTERIVYASYLIRFRFAKTAIATFLRHFFLSSSFQNAVRQNIHGGVNQNLHAEDIKNQFVALPPENEQIAIASFLDRETAKIDALVAEQQRLVELLKEKRQAVISHAVTKGLNPAAPLKPSGIEWLGDVPAHWEVMALRFACEFVKDGTHLPPPRVDDGVPLLSVRNVVDGEFVFRDDDSLISYADYEALCRSFIPAEGDVLLAIVGATLGKTAIIPKDMGKFHVQRSLAVFRPGRGRSVSRFLNLVFQSNGFQQLLWELVGFSAQPGIYLGTLNGLRIPIPPIEEQLEISLQTLRRCDEIDSLTAEAERAIELLQERRTALISAAVTGKIDVRHLATVERP